MRQRYVGALLAFSLVAAACGGEAVDSGEGPRASDGNPCEGEPEQDSVRVMGDWLPWASQGPLFEARERGFYSEEGLTVEIVSPAGAADPIRIVGRRQVDVALSYVPEVMISREEDIPVVSLGTTLRVLSSGLFFLPDSPVDSAEDLEGLTLAVPPKLDQQAFLDSVLKTAGLSKSDVKVVDPGFGPVPLVLERQVDGAAGLTYFEGLVAEDEVGEEPKWLLYRDHGVPPFYYQLLVASESWPAENPTTACRFLRATARGMEAWAEQPLALTEVAEGNDQVPEEMHRTIYEQTKDHWLSPDGEFLEQDASIWEEARDWALENDLIERRVHPSEYFTNEYLPSD